MLKKDFDTIHAQFIRWIFGKNVAFMVASMYGQKELQGMDKIKAFLMSEVLSFVSKANKTRNPNSTLIIPAGINTDHFNMIISNIKNTMI